MYYDQRQNGNRLYYSQLFLPFLFHVLVCLGYQYYQLRKNKRNWNPEVLGASVSGMASMVIERLFEIGGNSLVLAIPLSWLAAVNGCRVIRIVLH